MMVVLASAISQSIIDKAPIIFLKTSQGTAGQIDIRLTSSQEILKSISPAQFNYNLLNLTKINSIFNDYRKEITAPRFAFQGNISNICAESQINDGNQDLFSKMDACKNQIKSDFLFIDTKTEQYIGCGRDYPFDEIPEDNIIISQKLAKILSLNIGDSLFIQFNATNLIKSIYNSRCTVKGNLDEETKCKKILQIIVDNPNVVKKMKIFALLEEGYGKISGGSSTSMIFIEYQYLTQIVGQNLSPQYQKQSLDDFTTYTQALDPRNYVDEILINPPNRLDIYIDSNYDNIQFALTGLASRISNDLGVYPIDLTMPVLQELDGLKYGALFLGIILNIIIVVLLVLSILVLYNLLLVSIETQTYEMGVVRVLGINKAGVIWLIIVQSMFYVVPAVITGLLLSIPGLYYASNQINSAVGIQIGIYPTTNALILSLGLGILIPIISSVTPITEALKQTLVDALDLTRSQTAAVKIQMQVEGEGFSWTRVSFALITSMFGISIYYLLPLSLLSFNIGLLLIIFFVILIGLLIGCCLLAMNVQYLIEKLVVFLFFWWENAAIKNLIVKNLSAHRIKNRRTALMYAVSISFIIFIWTAMQIQTISSDYGTRRFYGSNMVVSSPSASSGNSNRGEIFLSNDPFITLPVKDLDELLSTPQMSKYIDDFAYKTMELGQFMVKKGVQSVYLTHLGRIVQLVPRVEAVTPNFYSVVSSEEFLKTVSVSDTGLSLIQELYTPRGSQSAIIGQTYSESLFIKRDNEQTMYLVVYNGTLTQRYETRVSSILKNSASFVFSDLPSVLSQSVVVSLPTFMRMGDPVIKGYDDIPFVRLYIKVQSGNEAADYVYKQLSSYINTQQIDLKIWDYRDFKKNVDQSQQLIDVIFVILTAIVMILCFFSLISSMTANLFQQTQEIAVVRSLGLTRNRMVRLYIYESFTLVFSSSLIGMFVGISVGFTMAMQRALFTGLPIGFVFPTTLLIVMFITSIVCSFVSTYFPAQKIMGKQISEIIRLTG